MTPWSRAATLAEATSRAVLALPAPVHDLLQIGDPTPPTSSPGALAAICQAFSASPLNQVGYSPWFGDRPMVAVGDGLECMPLAAHGPTALPAWLLAAAWHGMGQDIWDENEVILDAHADDVDRLDAALGGDGRWRGVAAWFRDPGNRDRASTAPTLAQIAIESEILLSLAPPRAEAAYRHGLAAIASASRPAIDAGALGPWSTPLAAHVLWATVQRGDQPDTTWAAICTLDAAAGIGTGVTVPGHLSVPVMAVSSGVLRAAAAAATATRDPVPGDVRELAQAILAGGPTYDGAAHASQARDAVERGEVVRALRRAWTAYYYAARTGARDPSWERQLIRTSLSVSPSG